MVISIELNILLSYYDRYLLKCKDWAEANNTEPPKTSKQLSTHSILLIIPRIVALALDQQIVDVGVIPLEETDQALDVVLSPTHLISK
jgi:5-formyltetrahydrofolate cyclo-ligase